MTSSAAAAATPVYLLTGFLGAGKTALLNSLLKQPGFRDTAVVVNEFGDIGLDHLLVAPGQENVVLLDAGCLCCAVLDSLRETLADLHQRRARRTVPSFQRVVIETTGLADPLPIMRTLTRDPVVSHVFRLQGAICVVDAVCGEQTLADHREAAAQVAVADRLLVTKSDLTGGVAPASLLAALRARNPSAAVLGAVNGAIDADVLLRGADVRLPWLASEIADDPEPGPRHDAVGSESFWIEAPVTWAGLAAWIDDTRTRLGPALLRCKAILNLGDRPVVLHGVQGAFDTVRLPAWLDEERRSRLVLIGRGLERESLSRSLHLLHQRP